MNKRQAGRLGGLTTARKHGREHMRAIARKGARAFHDRYQLQPIGINDFAIVDRESGLPGPKTLNGLDIQEYMQ